jgi:hypothetical protein
MNQNMKFLRGLVLILAVGAFPAFPSAQANPNSFNVGVVQVNGKIHLVAGNLAASLADFTLASADTGTLQTNIAFKSTRTVVENDEVDVIGDLTLTILERCATYNPTEDYAGPVYGERVAHDVTRPVVFVFPKAKLAEQNAKAEVSGTALIGRESFPELLRAIYAVNWPPLVEDERCQMPTGVGEDYTGPSCTGTVVETHNAASVLASVGEDYRGSETASPAGNQLKIVLNLQLTRESSVATASFFIG